MQSEIKDENFLSVTIRNFEKSIIIYFFPFLGDSGEKNFFPFQFFFLESITIDNRENFLWNSDSNT